jgi:hypothetical protein
VPEELENSLLKSVEAFLNERLQAIEEQLSKLQQDFHDQIARVRETASSTAMENTPLASTIAGHLQTAREQKLSGSAAPAPMDLSALKNGIKEIQNERTQSDVLTALLRAGARFADRTVLFVVKGNQAIAWRACQANRGSVEPVSGVAASLTEENVVGRAAQTRSIEIAALAGANGRGLIAQLGGDAQQAVAIPLVVRNKVVAVLYADSAWPHPGAIQLEALEVLERVATMAVELVSPRLAQTQPASIQSQPAAEPVREVAAIPVAAEAAAEETQAPAEVSDAQPSEAESAAVETIEAAPVSESTEPPIAEAPAPEPSATEAAPVPSPEPASFTPHSAPLGGARRFGSSEADLPVDVSDEERRLHNDARRFARLLISEIKLYNEQKVSEGRSRNDLYDRLREDIDRSRQMYDKRVAPPVAARHDYFHQELVNLLAEGDAAKLGGSYPGAAVAA